MWITRGRTGLAPRPLGALTWGVPAGTSANPMAKTRKVHRDAGTGRFTTKRKVQRSPKTTVTETVKVTKRKTK